MARKRSSEAGSVLGKRSVQARKAKWGEEEYLRRQRQYAKLGGRPRKGQSKKETGNG